MCEVTVIRAGHAAGAAPGDALHMSPKLAHGLVALLAVATFVVIVERF